MGGGRLGRALIKRGLENVSVVGHDLGGIVAYVHAVQHSSEVRRFGILEAPILGIPSPTLQKVLASYWHAQPRYPELLITRRERAHIAEFIRTYQCIDGVVANCGHWGVEEQPAQVISKLTKFMRY
jgi:pimeloyl-ACP methyl ester carboxylesterase